MLALVLNMFEVKSEVASTVALQLEGPGFESGRVPFSVDLPAWAFYRYFSFLPQPKDIQLG